VGAVAVPDQHDEVPSMGGGKSARRGCGGAGDDHECVGHLRYRCAVGNPHAGGPCASGAADCTSAGEDGQGGCQTVDPLADRRHRAGSMGAADGSARIAGADLVSPAVG